MPCWCHSPSDTGPLLMRSTLWDGAPADATTYLGWGVFNEPPYHYLIIVVLLNFQLFYTTVVMGFLPMSYSVFSCEDDSSVDKGDWKLSISIKFYHSFNQLKYNNNNLIYEHILQNVCMYVCMYLAFFLVSAPLKGFSGALKGCSESVLNNSYFLSLSNRSVLISCFEMFETWIRTQKCEPYKLN